MMSNDAVFGGKLSVHLKNGLTSEINKGWIPNEEFSLY